MLRKVKRKLYREGAYSCYLPTGDTSLWSVDDWCDCIDRNGHWVK
ncbi:MAG: hypothetical protein [Caudoviricetes sp.]|nr:MAG: hypothetical protein [Caudoviricetes sp.]